MKSSPEILEIDSLFVNHENLIKSTGICGLVRSYHDLRYGITIILSKDKHSTTKWHEWAHAFITQRGVLGIFMIFFTNALFALINQLKKPIKNERPTRKVVLVIERLKKIRRVLAENFNILHEVFALSTERNSVIEALLRKHDKIDRIIADCTKNIIELDKVQFSKGLENHKKALKIMEQFNEEYGVIFYSNAFSHWALCSFPLFLIKTDPSLLLYEEEENILQSLPNPKIILESIINEPPKWAPDQSLAYTSNFVEEVQRRATSITAYKTPSLFPKGALDAWMNKFISVLPLDDVQKEFLEQMQFHCYSYDLLMGKRRLKQLKGLARTEDLSNRKFQKVQNLKNWSFGCPWQIPPPIALIYENGFLKLCVRKDINNPIGLSHMAFRHVYMALNEFFLKEIAPVQVVLCFQSYTELCSAQCKKGPQNCDIAKRLYYMVKIRKLFFKPELRPILICAKDEKARILLLPDTGCDLIQNEACPFKIIEVAPIIYS